MRFSILASVGFAGLAAALPPTRIINRATGVSVTGNVATTVNDNDGNGAGQDTYTLHRGGGAAGFPAINLWVNFLDMFNANKPSMFESCEDNGWGANDSHEEVGDIYNAIEAVAAQTLVDHRFILAIIMQESNGCVRVPTTFSAEGDVRNPGLMQDHNGSGTCVGVNPCPQSKITQMIKDGTAGTSSGDGLAACINEAQNQYGVTGAQAFYYAARIYNSGEIPDPNNLGNSDDSTNCYVSDVANRLTGWVNAPSSCTESNVE